MLVGEAAPSGPVGGEVLASRAGQFFASAEEHRRGRPNVDRRPYVPNAVDRRGPPHPRRRSGWTPRLHQPDRPPALSRERMRRRGNLRIEEPRRASSQLPTSFGPRNARSSLRRLAHAPLHPRRLGRSPIRVLLLARLPVPIPRRFPRRAADLAGDRALPPHFTHRSIHRKFRSIKSR